MEFKRLEKIIGTKNLRKLYDSHVAVFGLGGVGGYVVEALARSGVGNFTIVDYDKVDITNINRQIIALHSTFGKYKTDLFESRIKDINSTAKIKKYTEKYKKEINEKFFDSNFENKNKIHTENLNKYDFVVDAIDMVSSKVDLIVNCCERRIPIISSMGMGNRINPECVRLTTLDKTYNCRLARVMRKELKAYGIIKLPCVFSDELPNEYVSNNSQELNDFVGSSAFVPPVAGFMIASYVVRKLIGEENEK